MEKAASAEEYKKYVTLIVNQTLKFITLVTLIPAYFKPVFSFNPCFKYLRFYRPFRFIIKYISYLNTAEECKARGQDIDQKNEYLKNIKLLCRLFY